MWYSLRITQLPAIITNRFPKNHVEAFPVDRARFAYSNRIFTFRIKEVKRGSAVDLFQSVQVEFYFIHSCSTPVLSIQFFLPHLVPIGHSADVESKDGEDGWSVDIRRRFPGLLPFHLRRDNSITYVFWKYCWSIDLFYQSSSVCFLFFIAITSSATPPIRIRA